MRHHHPQLECPASVKSREIDVAQKYLGSSTRRIRRVRVCALVLGILMIHWLGMQCFIIWLGGEEATAHGQSIATTRPSDQFDDGWRRTSKGWEHLATASSEAVNERSVEQDSMPSVHVSPSQIWPAAAAACMLLLIAGLPDKREKA